MKKTVGMAAVCLLVASSALAQSPIPTFDKEAVTPHPYNRTGQQDVISGDETPSGEFRPGNTGTKDDPAFYVKSIKLTGFELPDKVGRLQEILNKYQKRSVKVAELNNLTAEITAYAKECGYTVAQAVVPPQEVAGGSLEIKVYVANYDKINITQNDSDIATGVLNNYLSGLKPGSTITDSKLEDAINNINDLPGVQARAVLKPGGEPGTTSLDVEATRRPVWNNYVFVDNGGGYWSGRYRYGFNTEINNPGKIGDKFILNGMLSSHDVKNYGIRYELPIGSRGTRMGVAYSQSSYELSTNSFYDTLGKSKGISLYGMTPVYRDRSNRITAIYGYDHRDIEDELRFSVNELGRMKTEKDADVVHIGISGSQYNVNQFTQYSLIYWYGDINTLKPAGKWQAAHWTAANSFTLAALTACVPMAQATATATLATWQRLKSAAQPALKVWKQQCLSTAAPLKINTTAPWTTWQAGALAYVTPNPATGMPSLITPARLTRALTALSAMTMTAGCGSSFIKCSD